MTNIGTRVRFADKHATTNFHKTSRFLQVPGKSQKEKAEKMIHHQCPLPPHVYLSWNTVYYLSQHIGAAESGDDV